MNKITLRDKLSHLNYREACKLLGPDGDRLIREGGKWDIDLYEQATLDDKRFVLDLKEAIVTIELNPMKKQRLDLSCSVCSSICEHVGAAFSFILEEKLSLGLSAPPPELIPMENLGEEELIKWALRDRADESRKKEIEREAAKQARRDSVARAGGQLMSAAFSFIGELLGSDRDGDHDKVISEKFKTLLSECVEENEDGSLKMTIHFPDASVLENLAGVLSKITAETER